MPIMMPNEGGRIQNRLNQEIPPVPQDQANLAAPTEKRILSSLTFPNLEEVAKDEHQFSKKVPADDALLAELQEVLNAHASEIEKELEKLEKSKKTQEFVEVVLETEQWGGAVVEGMNNVAESIESGIEFLEHVIPPKLLVRLRAEGQIDQVKKLTTLGGALLSAMEFGLERLALIYKMKILRQSLEILELKKKAALQTASSSPDGSSSSVERKQLAESLAEWEMHLQMEQKNLAEDRLLNLVSTTYTVLSLASYPLSYIPERFTHLTAIPIAALSWTLSGLQIITLALQLKKESRESRTFEGWKEAYLKWQKETRPLFIRTNQKLIEDLFEWIDQNDLNQILNRLGELKIPVDPSIKTKEEFSLFLKTHPKFRQQVADAYIAYQRQLESLDAIIQTSDNLLDKRKEIQNQKVSRLKTRFESVTGNIHAWKKAAFQKEMQSILWEDLKDPNCSAGKIKEVLQKWGIYGTSASPKAIPFLLCLARFESSKERPSPIQEELIQEFHDWMAHPSALEEQFQSWYERETADNLDGLLASYVDHQETLENTTKNALKEMVHKKHEVEGRFINLKIASSKIYFTFAVVAFAITATLAILAFLSLPFGGAPVMLIALSIGSFALTMGSMGAAYAQANHEKPNLTQLLSLKFQLKMLWAKLNTSISTYRHQAKEKKLLEVAKILHELHIHTQENDRNKSERYQDALQSYKQAKQKFETSEEKVTEWTKRLNRFEASIKEKSGQDFALQASLQISEDSSAFDSLRAFQEAFQACDVDLLSDELKSLLKLQLGIDIEALQAKMNDDPDAIRKAMQEIFTLDVAGLMNFIKNQQERMHLGMLQLQPIPASS